MTADLALNQVGQNVFSFNPLGLAMFFIFFSESYGIWHASLLVCFLWSLQFSIVFINQEEIELDAANLHEISKKSIFYFYDILIYGFSERNCL